MSRRRIRGHPVDGVLLLDKPRGITSQAAVTRVRLTFGAAKAGHTGTLDPLADGLLPVCLGEATKFAQGLLDADKSYRAVVRLGVRTTTGDLEGQVIARQAAAADAARIEAALASLRGEVLQVPPMYSALKRDGRPLYEYARAGHEVVRQPRTVHVAQLTLEAADGPDFTIAVTCSKGTYVRVLAEDIGNLLGCGACLASLTRTGVGHLSLADAIPLPALEALDEAGRMERLLPVDALVSSLPRLDLTGPEAASLAVGRPYVRRELGPTGLCRAYAPDGRFTGLVDADPDGRVAPRRLVSSARTAEPPEKGRYA